MALAMKKVPLSGGFVLASTMASVQAKGWFMNTPITVVVPLSRLASLPQPPSSTLDSQICSHGALQSKWHCQRSLGSSRRTCWMQRHTRRSGGAVSFHGGFIGAMTFTE